MREEEVIPLVEKPSYDLLLRGQAVFEELEVLEEVLPVLDVRVLANRLQRIVGRKRPASLEMILSIFIAGQRKSFTKIADAAIAPGVISFIFQMLTLTSPRRVGGHFSLERRVSSDLEPKNRTAKTLCNN
jgi:hypothetical protein